MNCIVAKFGGTSLADATQIKRVKEIIMENPIRRFIVPSAPGKRFADDIKITDLLYACHQHVADDNIQAFEKDFHTVSERFYEIVTQLQVDIDIASILKNIKEDLLNGESKDYAASRGEFLNGQILAAYLGYEFLDPADVITFNEAGRYDEAETLDRFRTHMTDTARLVIPGFYGANSRGDIITFSRGGSDVTGAIVAQACEAQLYENWTDVSGFMMADPRIVDNPKNIEMITYKELRELSYMGAAVLHEEAIFPVRKTGIPINILNTNRPQDKGTLIVQDSDIVSHSGRITGVAGHKHFTVIAIEKALMNSEIGFGRRLLSILEANEVSFEHMPSGIDSISLVISDKQLINGKLAQIVDAIENTCRPDSVEVYPNMALIATVGRGMAYTPGVSSRLFSALADAGINIRMIDQGSSELNIIVGVENDDFERAIAVIYKAFA